MLKIFSDIESNPPALNQFIHIGKSAAGINDLTVGELLISAKACNKS